VEKQTDQKCTFLPALHDSLLSAAQLEESKISDPRTNDRIRVPEVRLIGPNGEQVGVVKIEAALRLAAENDLDLVEVAPNSVPPVAKIMDFGKFKYETAQKAKEARRNQTNIILKEVRFRLKIEDHDYTTKLKQAIKFLGEGDKVKAMIQFRGREQSRPELGVRLLQKFAENVAEYGTVEHTPSIDGRNMVMIISPLKNKTDVKAERQAEKVSKYAAKQAAEAVETVHVVAEKAEDIAESIAAKVQVVVEKAADKVEELSDKVEAKVEATVEAATKPAAAKKPAAASTAKAPATKAPAATSATAAKAPAAKAAPKSTATATKAAAAKSSTKATPAEVAE